MSDWAKALSAAIQDSADKIPKGFKTREQIQKEIGKGGARTREIIRQLISAKKAESRLFKIQTASGVRSVPHYRLK